MQKSSLCLFPLQNVLVEINFPISNTFIKPSSLLFLTSKLSYIYVQLKLCMSQVRGALKRAEKELERAQWVTPAALKHWLQLTHEIEQDYFNRKKLAADNQFKVAREEVSTFTCISFMQLTKDTQGESVHICIMFAYLKASISELLTHVHSEHCHFFRSLKPSNQDKSQKIQIQYNYMCFYS